MSSTSPTRSAFWTKSLFECSLEPTARRFWTWYKNEFFAFFPPATVAWLADRGDRSLIIRTGEAGPKILLTRGTQAQDPIGISPRELRMATLPDVLARHGISRESVKVRLEIPQDQFFVRRFDIPAAALTNLPQLLTAEIERKTPFRSSDVFSGHVVQDSVRGDKAHISQWIVRRDIVERLLEEVGLRADELDTLRPSRQSGGDGELPVILAGRRSEASEWFRYTLVGLTSLAVVFFTVGIAAALWRQNQLGEQLNAKIAAATTRAGHVRQMADQATRASALLASLRQTKKNVATFAALWEEASRILPDNAYATELRLSENKPGEYVVFIEGLAESAAELPVLFDRSPLFYDAALIAAITPDAEEKRERFSLQAKVVQKRAAKQK
jgi:general secretion pathway protein L